MKHSTDILRRIIHDDEGTFLEIGPWAEQPFERLEIRTTGEENIKWFGPINLVLDLDFAERLGQALLDSVRDMRGAIDTPK